MNKQTMSTALISKVKNIKQEASQHKSKRTFWDCFQLGKAHLPTHQWTHLQSRLSPTVSHDVAHQLMNTSAFVLLHPPTIHTHPSAWRPQRPDLVARNLGAPWRQWSRDKAFSPLLAKLEAFCLSALDSGRFPPQLWRGGGPSAYSLGSPLTRNSPLPHTGEKNHKALI